MAQTTGGASFKDVVLEYSTGGTTFTDISGVMNSIEVNGGDRKSGEAWTASGDTPIVTFGKREPIEVNVKVVYSESATEGFQLAYAAKSNGTTWYLRWAPKGSTTGNYRYTTGAGQVISCPEPGGPVESGEPILATFKFRCAAVTAAAIA
jgi:hypothetical protein